MANADSREKEFDILVFGATGFTGKHMVKEMLDICGTSRPWAIAGRTRAKLEQLKQELMLPENVGLIEANVGSEQSIRDMCTKTRLLINLVGPYTYYKGTMVVRICIEEECDYVDLTGEIEFIDEIRDKFGRVAEEKGVFIIPACGYVSVVTELAANFAQQKHPSLHFTYVSMLGMISNASNVHTGTWHSILEMISNWRKVLRSVKRLETQQASPLTPPRWPLSYNSQWMRWFTNSPSCNSYVMRISQSERAKRDGGGEPSLAISEMSSLGGFLRSILTILSLVLIFIPAQFSFIRRILLKFPKIVSFGLFSHEGPSEEDIQKSTFHCVLDATLSGTGAVEESETVAITVHVRGPDPGYIATSSICVNCALTLIEEKETVVSNTKKRGGVLTPGFAFENTSLIGRLNSSQKAIFSMN